MGPWTGPSVPGDSSPLSPALLSGPAEEVAPALLGARLVSTVGGMRASGVIVEVEAYVGPHDPACHAAERIGRTARNEAMFGRAGTAYVYFIYGMHWCVNVVTGPVDQPAAVLVRALDPLEGQGTMAARRGRRSTLCSGPARLCQALGIRGNLNGHDLTLPPLELQAGWAVAPERIGRSRRIGIREAKDWPLRFFVKGHPAVSRPRG